MPKQRPSINFRVPDLNSLQPTSAKELQIHQQKVTDLISYDIQGYSWRDAFFLAFGYNGIQPFKAFMEFAPNSVSSLTGRAVVNEEDFLDVVYAQFELEQREAELLQQLPEEPKRGRPRLTLDEQLARSGVHNEKRLRKERIQQAKDLRQKQLKELWAEYQQALTQKREAEEYHTKRCQDLFKQYQQLKTIPVDADDF